jgi:hypothetical protein
MPPVLNLCGDQIGHCGMRLEAFDTSSRFKTDRVSSIVKDFQVQLGFAKLNHHLGAKMPQPKTLM